jgi:hypothetical protein
MLDMKFFPQVFLYIGIKVLPNMQHYAGLDVENLMLKLKQLQLLTK